MKKYEVMFIIKPDAQEEVLKKSFEDIKSVFVKDGGTILEEKDLGNKELAYEVDKYNKGHYFWFIANANETTVKEFDRAARLNESIIRFICVKVGE